MRSKISRVRARFRWYQSSTVARESSGGACVSVFGKGVIRITVHPALTGFGGGDHRVAGVACVARGVSIRRFVAAMREAALLAGSQVHPPRPDLHALDALAPL